MSLKERIESAGPAGRVLAPVVEELLDHVNNSLNTGDPSTIYSLLTELTTDLNAHMADDTAHTNDDDVTTAVATDTVDTKAKAIARVNALRTAYEAHRVRLEDAGTSAVHGAADETNVVALPLVPSTGSLAQVDQLADQIRTAYEAHRVLTTDSVHASADNTNSVSATAVGLTHIATLEERDL